MLDGYCLALFPTPQTYVIGCKDEQQEDLQLEHTDENNIEIMSGVSPNALSAASHRRSTV
jgi:hypothetical protein